MPEKVENTLVCLKLRFAQCSEGLKRHGASMVVTFWGLGNQVIEFWDVWKRPSPDTVFGCGPWKEVGWRNEGERGEEQVALYCFSVVIFILCWTFTCRCETVTPREERRERHCSKCELEITNRMLSATPRLPDCNLYIVALQKESQGFSIRH